jgi:hypothetical protein
VKANLAGPAVTYISNLCKPSKNVNPNSALRFPLQIALLISPLCLLLPLNLEKRSFNRGALMQLSISLGARKPEVLQQTEKRIWKAILDIVNQPGDYLAIMKDLASQFPSSYIEELEKKSDSATGWFNIDISSGPSQPTLSLSGLSPTSTLPSSGPSPPPTLPSSGPSPPSTTLPSSGPSPPSATLPSIDSQHSGVPADQLMDIGAATVGGEKGVDHTIPSSGPSPPSATLPSIDSQHSGVPADQLMDIGAATVGGEKGVDHTIPSSGLSPPSATLPSIDSQHSGVPADQLMDIGAATVGGEKGVDSMDLVQNEVPDVTRPSRSSRAAIGGGEKGVEQMDLVQNEVPDVTRPSRSSRLRKNHPINEHSKSLSTSTSKKKRNRPPAIADQTPLSQKRVAMDESLNILVVCTFPPFF